MDKHAIANGRKRRVVKVAEEACIGRSHAPFGALQAYTVGEFILEAALTAKGEVEGRPTAFGEGLGTRHGAERGRDPALRSAVAAHRAGTFR